MGPPVLLARGPRSSRGRRRSPLPLIPWRRHSSQSGEAQSEGAVCHGWTMTCLCWCSACCAGPATPRPRLGLLGVESPGDLACTGRLPAAVGRRFVEGWLGSPCAPPPPPSLAGLPPGCPPVPLPPPRECWLSHVCTGGRQNKAQKKMWLVSGLQDHWYLSVKIESKDARG